MIARDRLITLDETRTRAVRPSIESDVVERYAEAYRAGEMSEPLHVFYDGKRYVVADGEHRLLAAELAGVDDVEAVIHEGDEIDALDFAAGCNHTHGLPATKEDRFHTYCRIMDTPRLRQKYDDSDLAEKLHVSQRTIEKYKAEWREAPGGDATAKRGARKNAEAKTTRSPSPNGDNSLNDDELELQITSLTTGIDLLANSQLDPVIASASGRIEWDTAEKAAQTLLRLLKARV